MFDEDAIGYIGYDRMRYDRIRPGKIRYDRIG